MTPRPAAGLLVSALIRAVEAAGGSGMVLAKGDATAGAILLVLVKRGRTTGLCERTLDRGNRYAWTAAGPAIADDPAAVADYLARRRRNDPDQWIIELDHAEARALADGMIG